MSVNDDVRFPAVPELQLPLTKAADRLIAEFDGIFSPETIRLEMADSCTAFADATNPGFVPAFVERFTRQRLRAQARTEGKISTAAPMVVFLCVHNAGRSQMAAGWLRHLGGSGVEVFSGGSDPASEVNPAAIASMREVGIDISSEFPKPWTDDVLRAATVIVTMGCGDSCPVYPGIRYRDWPIADPAGLPVEEVRPIRDDVGVHVRELMDELGIAPVGG